MITEENFLDFKCPYCGEPVSFPENAIGSAQECPNCMESLIVPEAGSETGEKLPIPITTPRLILRRFAMNDWEELMKLLSDEDFLQYTDGLAVNEEEQVLHWLESDGTIKLTTPNQMFRLAIELQDGNQLIGHLGLWFPKPSQAMLNINLHRNYQRKGFALEAVKALLGFCFWGIKLHRVSANCDSRNTAACRLFASVGMRREGEFVKSEPAAEGGWSNSIWYAILEEECQEDTGSPEGSST
jgi:RimJ/RimL family protein N-acetyltransferase